MNSFLIIIYSVLGLCTSSLYDEQKFEVISPSDTTYRAAKYSLLVDLSLVNEIMSYHNDGLVSDHKRVTVFHYFIQYGNNRVIHILEPDSNLGFMGTFFNDWDYAEQIRKTTLYLEHVKKYIVSSDSIRFFYTKSTGKSEGLCRVSSNSTLCDSVKYTSYSEDAEATVCFDSSIYNIPFYGLLYPDIRYLPIKIYGWGSDASPLTLEDYFVGKSEVDSLINLFTFKDYSLISDNDDGLNSIEFNEVIDLIDFFDQTIKTRD